MSTGEESTPATQIENPILVGVLMGFSISNSNWVLPKPRPKTARTECIWWFEKCNSPPIKKRGKGENKRTKQLQISARVKTEIERRSSDVGHTSDHSSD
jgi:hypothetical protein